MVNETQELKPERFVVEGLWGSAVYELRIINGKPKYVATGDYTDEIPITQEEFESARTRKVYPF